VRGNVSQRLVTGQELRAVVQAGVTMGLISDCPDLLREILVARHPWRVPSTRTDLTRLVPPPDGLTVGR
jgi:hypothetical protein